VDRSVAVQVAAHKSARARRVHESLFARVLRFVPSLRRRGRIVEDTMSEPVVDVGIPTHGRPQYLRETVESVLAQTLTSWRLTISENGAEGAVISGMLEPYLSDPRVNLVSTGSAVSAPQNATRAIQAGHGRYVALLHDDDRWDPGFLSRRVSFLELYKTCGLVFSHCNYIGEAGDIVYRYTANLREGLQPRRTFLRTLYRQNVIAAPTVLTRRSAYDAVGPAFSEPLLFDDWEMWLRIAAHFDVGFLDVYDADYRIHTSQSSHDGLSRMGEHRLELLDEVDRWLSLDVPAIDRKRARSGAHFRASYDALLRGERRRSAAQLLRALRSYPFAVLDPEVGRLGFAALRFRVRQRALWKGAARKRTGS
jgi:glycosyltransferase involved in cell wall biosynthesis